VLVAALYASKASAEEPDAACSRTVLAYASAWDRGDGASFEGLFTSEATLDVGFGPAVGRPAIAALFARHLGTATTRHFMANIQITPVSQNEAAGLSYVQLLAGPRTEIGADPIPADGYVMAGEYHDRFEVDAGICRFVERKLVVIFRRPRP